MFFVRNHTFSVGPGEPYPSSLLRGLFLSANFQEALRSIELLGFRAERRKRKQCSDMIRDEALKPD